MKTFMLPVGWTIFRSRPAAAVLDDTLINRVPIYTVWQNMARRKPTNDRWHDRRKLIDWFSRLTPEHRLKIALEIEQFRREARFIETNGESTVFRDPSSGSQVLKKSSKGP